MALNAPNVMQLGHNVYLKCMFHQLFNIVSWDSLFTPANGIFLTTSQGILYQAEQPEILIWSQASFGTPITLRSGMRWVYSVHFCPFQPDIILVYSESVLNLFYVHHEPMTKCKIYNNLSV